jgi:cytochrome c oxidase cbb3-type subunit 4
MELYTTLSSAFTVISFLTFIGIVQWAWSSRRRDAFAAAAAMPFALPDETTIDDGGSRAVHREAETAADSEAFSGEADAHR